LTEAAASDADLDWHDAVEVEGTAVSAFKDVDTADVGVLLKYVVGAEVGRQQVQPILEQACERLMVLRKWCDEAVCDASSDAFHLVIRGLSAVLGSGHLATFDALALLEAADDDSIIDGDERARLLWARALVLALELRFEQAAKTCADAARIDGLGSERRWQLGLFEAELCCDDGREFAKIEPLQAAIKLYEQALLPMTLADPFSAHQALIHDALGTANALLGQRHRGTRPTELAVESYRKALGLWQRETQGDEWAASQNRLGNALGFLGQRQRDGELLEASVGAFDAALEEQTARPASGAYASTYSNLAAVLQSLGQQKQDAKLLKRAVDSYKSVLAVWSREHRPIMWAATMSNLGSALRLLGQTRKGPRTLEQSVAAFTAALSVRTRDRLPHDWAMTQNNLGAALQALGERTEDEMTFGKAVAAYRETVKELSADGEPMSWAMAMANLGVARRKLAERNGDLEIAKRSAQDIKAAIDIFRGASHAQLTELGEEQLSLARKLAAEIEAAHAQA
jgi:tetratricopeptide (TPR) repeat protein